MGQKANLTMGPVFGHLVSLTFPMIFGIFAIVAFNFADTYFVAQLGTKELAAMSFTFPVVMSIAGIALGLGTAAGSVISRAIGEGDYKKVKRLATDSLRLSFLIVVLFVIGGLISIKPVFTLLGASPEILVLIKEYMTIWYIGMAFVVVPMVGNNAIRASGNVIYPCLIMVGSASINVILDPLLIFGLYGFPKLGLSGAALATVIARAISLIFSLAVLHFKEKMLDFSFAGLKYFFDSCKKILYIGIPSATTNIIVPLSVGIVTRLVAQFGTVAVAAIGAGTRIGAVALIVIMALSTALIPFIGQNWGAKNLKRVHLSIVHSNRFALLWGILMAIALFLLANPLANLFSRDPLVIHSIINYLWLVPFGYGLRSICMLAIAVFNAINRPLIATSLSLVWMFCLYIPFAYIGSYWGGVNGIFLGIGLSSILAGIIALAFLKVSCRVESAQQVDFLYYNM